MRGQVSEVGSEAAGQRKRLWGPGATCTSSQEACGATAVCLEHPRETPPQPGVGVGVPAAPPYPALSRGDRSPSTGPCAANSHRLEKLLSRTTCHPHPRTPRSPGECGHQQSWGGACSAAPFQCVNHTSHASLNSPPPY